MPYFLVNVYRNPGWGTRIDNEYKFQYNAGLCKNRYRAMKMMKDYGYPLTKGVSSQDDLGRHTTIYYADDNQLMFEVVQIEVE